MDHFEYQSLLLNILKKRSEVHNRIQQLTDLVHDNNTELREADRSIYLLGFKILEESARDSPDINCIESLKESLQKDIYRLEYLDNVRRIRIKRIWKDIDEELHLDHLFHHLITDCTNPRSHNV